MNNTILNTLKCATIAAVAVCASTAMAASPPTVSYTVSGSSGNYDLDFTVNNNVNQDLYFFGVELSARNITGSPAGFDPNAWTSWDNSGYGGSAIVYNNNWIDFGYTSLPAGGSLSGFDVHITDAVAPTSVKWFAYTVDDFGGNDYTGGGNINNARNPGFEGVAGAGVPDAGATSALLGIALGGLGLVRRSKLVS